MPTAAQPIEEIVSRHASAAAILQRFEIDLCQRAGQSLERACADLQLSVDQVLEKLVDAEAGDPGAPPADPARMPIGRLIQHIVRVHHRSIRQELPRLVEMAQTLSARQSDHARELERIAPLIERLRVSLLAHIEKEEQILFPFIAQMDQDSSAAYSATQACFRAVSHPVFVMIQEHEAAAQILTELNRVTNGFEAPEWACATHRALLAGLRTFEADLKLHVHLENDILFPRAITLETELKSRG